MSTQKKHVTSPIQLPGGPDTARDAMDFRPRPGRVKADPKAESVPEPVATEQPVEPEMVTPPETTDAPVLAPQEHPSTRVAPAPEMPVEPAPEAPAPESTKSESKKPAAKRPAARPKRAPGNLLED